MPIRPFLLLFFSLPTWAPALTVQVDYRYDTNQFFSAAGNPGGASGAAQARAALQAAADRWGAIIDQPLGAVSVMDDGDDVRIGFNHPGTGASFQVSSANSIATDSLASFGPAANEYRGAWSIPADTWIIYAGARNISSAGIGGTGTGLNYTCVQEDPDGIHNRGFNIRGLPVWGGAITFSNASTQNWHFDHTTAAGSGASDFYSIALHEIGHVLGLAAGWDDWERNVSAGYFNGSNAVAAYNADNGAQLSRLLLQGSNGEHWRDGSYDSAIFPAANPNYVGTVGAGSLQDLLMEPSANFSFPALRRFEVTNVDVGALRDIGWSTIDALSPTTTTLMISSVTRDPRGAMVLGWPSLPGESYTVQTSLDMRTWSDVTPAVRAVGLTASWSDGAAGSIDPNPPSAQSAAKYYRVRKN